MSQHPFNVLDHIRLTSGPLHISSAPEMSGGGTQPPPKPPKAPVKKPGKRKK